MAALTDQQRTELEAQLEALLRRQRVITSKETLRKIQYDAAEIKWRLGLMTDEEFAEAEEFHDNFLFEF